MHMRHLHAVWRMINHASTPGRLAAATANVSAYSDAECAPLALKYSGIHSTCDCVHNSTHLAQTLH